MKRAQYDTYAPCPISIYDKGKWMFLDTFFSVIFVYTTRSIGTILSLFHSGSMQNNQNFIYNYCVLKTKIKYLVS